MLITTKTQQDHVLNAEFYCVWSFVTFPGKKLWFVYSKHSSTKVRDKNFADFTSLIFEMKYTVVKICFLFDIFRAL